MTSDTLKDAEISPPVPPPPTRLERFAGAFLAFVGGAAWLVLLVILAMIVPRFEVIFADFDIKGGLPESTQVVISASHVVRGLGIFLLPVVTVTTFILIGFCIAGRGRAIVTVSFLFGVLSFLILQVAVVVIAVGLLGPLSGIITGVSGGGGGGRGPDD